MYSPEELKKKARAAGAAREKQAELAAQEEWRGAQQFQAEREREEAQNGQIDRSIKLIQTV